MNIKQRLETLRNYFDATRGCGHTTAMIRGGMFKADLNQIDKAVVQKTLDPLKFDDFILADITSKTKNKIPGATKVEIKPFVENVLGVPFKKGNGHYALQKLEEVQENKSICVRDTRNGRVYTGDGARTLIGLPTGKCGTVKVKPEGNGIYEIFIQSTSINRILTPGTKFIYLKNK